METTVFVNISLREDELRELRRDLPSVTFRDFAKDASGFERNIHEADVVLGRGTASTISPEALGRANRLKWIHSWAAGPNEMLFPEMLASHVMLTSSAGSGAISMAEHAVMLMLMLSRDMVGWIRAQQEHRWEQRVHSELHGLTCGIIGLGHTGQDLARKLHEFNMRVIGIRRRAQPTQYIDEVFTADRLTEFLSLSDYIVITTPRTPETMDMLGEAQLRLMKPTAYLICSSRGGVANEEALLRALQENWIAGAGLDAFVDEPLAPTSPFWAAPNTIVTPHSGASTQRRRSASLRMFQENLRRFVRSEPLLNIVDKEAGY